VKQRTVEPEEIIQELRSLVPLRPLNIGECYILAEKQATYALELVGQTQPEVSLRWVTELPKVAVKLQPGYKMTPVAGAMTFSKGRYVIVINKNDCHARRRFTLAHEFKHTLDYSMTTIIHQKLGYGDSGRQEEQIEQICNHFAACLLMPRIWIKRVWRHGIQDVSTLALLFNVSEDAMSNRLHFLGFIDDNPQPVHTYFRRPVYDLAA
jgi:Zn-dependent peptidase ImmA (M78 family)